MCNSILNSKGINKVGYGWKLFNITNGKARPLVFPSLGYSNINERGVVVGQWEEGLAFCFFLNKELAETWADYWSEVGHSKPEVKKIQYWGGRGKRNESGFIRLRGAVEIAFCNSFRVVKEIS